MYAWKVCLMGACLLCPHNTIQSSLLQPLACLLRCFAKGFQPACAAVQGNYENGGAYTFILLITFWILYSYLVPISLFVSLEIVKFWQVAGGQTFLP